MKKKEFTDLLKSKVNLAKEPASSISSEEVVDGSAAVIRTAKGETGYDLRLINEKGLLPPNHPLLIASQLNINKSFSQTLDDFDLVRRIKSHFGFNHAQLVENAVKAPNDVVITPFTENFIEKKVPYNLVVNNFLYAGATNFYPEIIAKARPNHLIIEMPKGVGLAFFSGKNDCATAFKGRLTALNSFWASYFNFIHHIALNEGSGRIAGIESLIKSALPDSLSKKWRIEGTYVLMPQGNLKKQDFHKEGLLVTDTNFSAGIVALNVPLSVFDLQIDQILNKLIKIGKDR